MTSFPRAVRGYQGYGRRDVCTGREQQLFQNIIDVCKCNIADIYEKM